MSDRSLANYTAGKMYEWDKWSKELPYLTFPRGCEVKVMPPFAGAVVRFSVKKGKNSVSVYFDAYGELGAMREPYWEIYPAKDGEPERFLLGEEEQMMKAILASLRKRR
jgi:hypothetical protein